MNAIKEFLGNIPIFQRQVAREIEEKGINPTSGVKKVEASRQVLRKLIVIGLVLLVLIVGVILFFQNKNQLSFLLPRFYKKPCFDLVYMF